MSGRYQVLTELGRGSGSIVYLARHQKLGEYRAVKCIKKEPDFIWKVREASILNRLNHPQIPRFYDMEEDEESYYIVEEYARGESLEAKMLQSSVITLDFIIQVITETAKILDYMHHLEPIPMIYQDLKPEHIILSRDGIKLIDFGIASYLGETGNKFQNYGTPKFCAPEKATGKTASIQSDIYSIGKLLEELVCAEGSHQARCLMQVADKATSPDLSIRYQTAEELLADLSAHMQSKQNSIYQKHLLTKIVAAGSQPRIGTTHLSISLTAYLNQKNKQAVYLEKNTNGHMRMSIQNGIFAEEGGLYRRNNFLGMPAYGEGVSVNIPKGSIEILDYGTDIAGALSEGADMILFVIGSRYWETDFANCAFQTLKKEKNVFFMANYGCKRQARLYHQKYGQPVYCFPLDADPFEMTKEKECLFNGLLEKERKNKKKYWNCRICLREWGNALIRGIGKLCSKRLR